MNTEVRTRSRAKVPLEDSRSASPAAAAGSRVPVAGSRVPAGGQRTAPGSRVPVAGGQRTAPGRTSPARRTGPTRPTRLAGLDRLASPEPQASRSQEPGRALLPVARTPFILLVLGLLGGGLICLLVINTTLAAGSFQITHLQQDNVTLAQRVQELKQQLASEESPAGIEKQALQLGMRPQQRLSFINASTGRIYRQPATEPGVTAVPGYFP
jgi:hypothetical protein